MALLVSGSADSNLIQKWDEKLKSCQQARLNFERQWHENLAFLSGRQWITTSRNPNGTFSLSENIPADKWRVRHVANRILRILRTELTKLSKEEPQFFCMPSSTDESDRLAAMAGDAIADYIMRTRYFNRKRTEATFWALVCGTSFLKNWYDEKQLDVDGEPGKIDFEADTPFHIFVPNLQASDIQQQPYVIHARTINPEDVYNWFHIDLPPGTASTFIAESRFLASIGVKNAKEAEQYQCYIKEVYVKPCKDFQNGATFIYGENTMLYVYENKEEEGEMFSIPPESEQLELSFDGAVEPTNPEPVGMAQRGVPEIGNRPDPVTPENTPQNVDVRGVGGYEHTFAFRHGRFPWAKIDHIMSGGFYNDSVIKHLISTQKEYNRTRSNILELRNKAAKPQYWYNPGAFDLRKWRDEPGLTLPVNMGFDPPQPIAQPDMHPVLSEELNLSLQDMDDISSQFEVAKGRIPPGIEAASAIAYLSEENDTILYHTVQSLENAVQETGVQVLANVHDWWPEERIVRMTSRNQYLEVREFKKQDLNPLMDFRVETNSMAPKSLAARQAFITELMKMGALAPEQGLRYLQMSETNKLYDEIMLDARHAQRENVYMSQGQKLRKPQAGAIDPNTGEPVVDPNTGQPIPQYKMSSMVDPTSGMETGQMYEVTINPFDNHPAHIEEHEKFQKSQEYELLPPEIQQVVQDHVDEHKMEMIKEKLTVQQDVQMNGEVGDMPPPRELEGNQTVSAGNGDSQYAMTS